MFRIARTAAAAAVVGAVAFYLLLGANYRSTPEIRLRTDGDLQALGRGFYPFEKNADLAYAWTDTRAELAIPAIDRRLPWRLTGNANIWRPPGVPRPRVVVSVDGVPVIDRVFRGPFALDIPIAPRVHGNGVTIIIESSPAFLPGPEDPRSLGIAVAGISIAPEGQLPPPPLPSVLAGALAIAMLATVAAALRMPLQWVLLLVVAVAAAQAWLMTRGIAAYVNYAPHAVWLAAGLGGAALIAGSIFERAGRARLTHFAGAAVTVSLAACYLKLLVLMHPSMPIGDGVFHAHRLEYVMGGRLYFTSVTPDNYSFPYPVLLYVVATPFTFFTADTLDRLALLRLTTTTADAVAGLLLYWMIVRTTANYAAGVASVVWYHSIPITAWIMTWGNLTNAFGQSLFVAGLALVAGLPVTIDRRKSVALLVIVASAALLTHPSTCAILLVILTATAVLYTSRRAGDLRASGNGVFLATLLAGAIALAVYYVWFPRVYLSELTRVASESGARASAVTAPAVRTAKALDLATMYFGWAAAAAAAVGAWRLCREGAPPRLRLLLLAWAGTSVVFLVVGILTPIDLRYHFAAFPALAVAAGFTCAWAWQHGIVPRAAAALMIGAGAWEGISQWMRALSPR